MPQNPPDESCRVALLTAPGRSAVATIGVAGPGAVSLVSKFFSAASGKELDRRPGQDVAFGRWRQDGSPSGDSPGEEVIMSIRDENRVEIHCHGGQQAPDAILASLQAAGAQRIDWRSWVALTSKDPFQAAALAALAAAQTEKAAAVLAHQFRGVLRRAWIVVERDLEQNHDASPKYLDQARRRLLTLKRNGRIGAGACRAFRVVLCGRPNVGKSSLMNRIVGYQRSIIYRQPGTTRDVVTCLTAIDGWPVELFDTAGIRTAADSLEAEGVARARRAVAQADLVIVVCDASQPMCQEDRNLIEDLAPAIVILNKCDLPHRLLAEQLLVKTPAILVSALTGHNLDALLNKTASLLAPDWHRADSPTPFTDDQLTAIETALAHLEHGRPAEALSVLQAVSAASIG